VSSIKLSNSVAASKIETATRNAVHSSAMLYGLVQAPGQNVGSTGQDIDCGRGCRRTCIRRERSKDQRCCSPEMLFARRVAVLPQRMSNDSTFIGSSANLSG
jgi:hypothetical protein